MVSIAESGGIPGVGTKFSLSVENARAGAGQDGRTRLVKPNLQAQKNGTEKKHISCLADHKQDWRLYLVDPYSAERAHHTL